MDVASFALRPCRDDEIGAVADVINDGASAYRGVIPDDRWREPYMPVEELQREVAGGVRFWGVEAHGTLIGVMGLQDVSRPPAPDVTLIRHAYVRTAWRRLGVGGRLLRHLLPLTSRPVLVGTWADAVWAVRFYRRHGFGLITGPEKDRLLNTYWSLHPRQVETSVVLADRAWITRGP